MTARSYEWAAVTCTNGQRCRLQRPGARSSAPTRALLSHCTDLKYAACNALACTRPLRRAGCFSMRCGPRCCHGQPGRQHAFAPGKHTAMIAREGPCRPAPARADATCRVVQGNSPADWNLGRCHWKLPPSCPERGHRAAGRRGAAGEGARAAWRVARRAQAVRAHARARRAAARRPARAGAGRRRRRARAAGLGPARGARRRGRPGPPGHGRRGGRDLVHARRAHLRAEPAVAAGALPARGLGRGGRAGHCAPAPACAPSHQSLAPATGMWCNILCMRPPVRQLARSPPAAWADAPA